MSNFDMNLLKNKNLSNTIRLYLVSKNKHYFINEGKIVPGFDNTIKLTPSRESILDAFSKMTFLFDEIIRLRLVGYFSNSKSKELLYLLNLIPVNRKIRTFLDWKMFDPEYTRAMSRLFEVRNDAIHCVTLNEVSYNPKTIVSLGKQPGFKKFKNDFQKAWHTLIQIYISEQKKIDFEKLSKDLLL